MHCIFVLFVLTLLLLLLIFLCLHYILHVCLKITHRCSMSAGRFFKAFDVVGHEIVINKLTALQLPLFVLSWITSFL